MKDFMFILNTFLSVSQKLEVVDFSSFIFKIFPVVYNVKIFREAVRLGSSCVLSFLKPI